jgi:hypothetical protein
VDVAAAKIKSHSNVNNNRAFNDGCVKAGGADPQPADAGVQSPERRLRQGRRSRRRR